MDNARDFDLSDVLSIVMQGVVSTRGLQGVHDIMAHVLRNPKINGDDIDLLGPFARLEILNQHPELKSVKAPWLEATITFDGSVHSISDWLAAQKGIYGETLPVAPLSVESLAYASTTVLRRGLSHRPSLVKEDFHL